MLRDDRKSVELERVKQELAELKEEHRRVVNSISYRLGLLLTRASRSPRKALRLPLDIVRLVKSIQVQQRPPGPQSEPYSSVQLSWARLVTSARQSKQPLVFIFSGTTCVQGTRGNRPIRQTQALLRRGARVFFSYHRSRYDEPLPDYTREGLVQSPIDITLQLLDKIASTDIGAVPKLFVVSYPYPGIEKYLGFFRQKGWRVIYDCRDDWEEFSKVGMARWFDADVEQKVVAGCDVTMCVSGILVEKMHRLAPGSDVRLVPNAVESDFLPKDYKHEALDNPPVVGYFGHLADAWFNWDAFIRIARACPQYRFEIIGHSAPKDLELPVNVQLLGPKPWQELHRYACRWRVGIIPFRMGALADGVDPIKIYEYLSFGLPVVSFRMPQIEHYPYTSTVGTVEEFCIALAEASTIEPDKELISRFIAENTWERRAEQLLALAGVGCGVCI